MQVQWLVLLVRWHLGTGFGQIPTRRRKQATCALVFAYDGHHPGHDSLAAACRHIGHDKGQALSRGDEFRDSPARCHDLPRLRTRPLHQRITLRAAGCDRDFEERAIARIDETEPPISA